MDYDKLAAGVPVNAQTARTMGKGIQYTPDKKITQFLSENPPPLVNISPREENLTGKKFGKFVVIGKMGTKGGSSKTALWAVRCLCGRYCARRSKAINNPANTVDCCPECQQLAYLKRRDYDKQAGKFK